MAQRQGSKENQALVEQVMQIAAGLGETLAPFTEVVVHDLRTPRHAILAIHNNLSGRTVGDPATELGLARIADNNYPQIIANYPNKFADGRRSKSTSIGIKDSEGRYVAALCLNVDVTLFKGLASILEKFSSVEGDTVFFEGEEFGFIGFFEDADGAATLWWISPDGDVVELGDDDVPQSSGGVLPEDFIEVSCDPCDGFWDDEADCGGPPPDDEEPCEERDEDGDGVNDCDDQCAETEGDRTGHGSKEG